MSSTIWQRTLIVNTTAIVLGVLLYTTYSSITWCGLCFFSYCAHREGEILRKLPGDIDGQPFDLTSLNRCEVALLDRSEAVQVDELTDCR